jgi:acetylglutamate kinase
MTADEASQLLRDADWLSADINRYLPCAVRASRTGVGRVHLIGLNRMAHCCVSCLRTMASARWLPANRWRISEKPSRMTLPR